MRIRIASDRMNETQIVCQSAQVLDQIRNHFAAIPPGAESVERRRQIALLTLECDQLFRPATADHDAG